MEKHGNESSRTAMQAEQGAYGELISLTLLLDFYGVLLTQRQSEVLALHCNDDLSLAEIAKELGISRQAAHDAIATGRTLLYRYEEKLALVERFSRERGMVEQAREQIREALDEQEPRQSRNHLKQAGVVLEKLMEQL